MNEIPEGKKDFTVRDLEIINFWLNAKGSSKYITNYSSELKQYFDYKNFSLDVRQGTTSPFSTGRSGMANFKYNDVVYGLIEQFSITADHIIYVPTETEDTPESILNAAQARINNYVGEEKAELTYVSTAKDYFINNIGEVSTEYDTFADAFYYEYGIENVSENDLIYTVDVFYDENSGNTHKLIIRRDSSKMINPTYVTSDFSTDITISSNQSEIPLDTMINATELTSGTEYEKILEILNLTDNITFDLKLYSDSLDEYITKLEDGSFEVKIPIPEDFKGKDLAVYYVNDNEEKEPYTVDTTSEPGYAIFTTTHFSIYTLGYTAEDEVIIDFTKSTNVSDFNFSELEGDMINFLEEMGLIVIENKGKTFKNKNGKLLFTVDENGKLIFTEGLTTDDNIVYILTEEEQQELKDSGVNVSKVSLIFSTKKPTTDENPKTFDGIGISIFTGTILLIGLVGAIIYLKKEIK